MVGSVSAVEHSGRLHTAYMGTDVSAVSQLLVVYAGDSLERVEMCAQLSLLASYIALDFAEHLEKTQQMEFNAPTNPRHLITGSQAAV